MQNFRSTNGVIDWVNEVFDRVLVASPGVQPANTPLVSTGSGLADESRSICVIRAEPADSAEVAREKEADLIAGAIRRAVDEGWTVRDEPARRPAVRRRRDPFPNAYRDREVRDRAPQPGDPLSRRGRSWFLRPAGNPGPIQPPRGDRRPGGHDRAGCDASVEHLACTDEEIYLHVVRHRRLDYRSETTDSESVATAFAELLDLHSFARERRRLVREAVVRTRLIEIALTGWDGGQAAANIAKLVEQARAFSARGGGGLRAFARWLTDQRGTADTEDAGVSEITDEVVRLVTMHASKGLEYPIVALANLGSRGATRIRAGRRPRARRLELRVTAGSNKFQTPGFEAAWTAERRSWTPRSFACSTWLRRGRGTA